MNRIDYQWQVKTKTAVNIGEFLESARQQLRGISEQPLSDAQALLAFYLARDRAYILAHPEASLTLDQYKDLQNWVSRLKNGEPMAYIIGQWEFYGRKFKITPHVLIPRPETELLIEQALLWLHNHPFSNSVADVGTGSGCIAVTLQLEQPDLRICAVDISHAALQVAYQNSDLLGTKEKIHFIQSDLLSGLQGPFDLICANLPYIPSQTTAKLPVSRFEPVLALDGGEDGLDLVRRLITDAPRIIKNGGCLLLEVEAGHGELAPKEAKRFLPEANIEMLSDYAGLPRLLKIQFPDF